MSVPSDLPTAAELTTALLRKPRRQPVATGPKERAIARVPQFLRLLKAYDEADIKRVGYARRGDRVRYQPTSAIFRAKTSTYEDLFFLCSQLKDWGRGWSDDCLATPLMEALDRRGRTLFSGRSMRARLSDVASVATAAVDFIEVGVARALTASNPVGLELVGELASAPNIDELNIVTLNHDTLVEQLLVKLRIPFLDGFGERDGDVRWFSDGAYDAPAKVRLFKLHGSIDWFVSRFGRTVQFVGNDPWAAHDGDGQDLTVRGPGPSFLSGHNKSISYQRGVYAHIHYRFHGLLQQCNRMVMCGYGWGDAGINYRLEDWLDDPRGNKVLLLHPDPNELEWSSLTVVTSFEAWLRLGRLVSIKKWLCDTRFDELGEFLNERA